MTTISKLAYQIVADTSGFTKGVTLTRNELALTKQVMRDSISPTQAYAAELAALDKVLAKGAITQQQYTEAAGRLKAEFAGELGTKIRNVGATTAAVAGTITAGIALMGKSMLDAYAGGEVAQAKLEAAMRSNGTTSAATLSSYQAMAAEMQRLTTVDDDAATGMLQLAESLGVTGSAAERAVKNAIGMEAALGVDRDSAMKMTVALEQGSTKLLTKFIPALKSIEDPAQRAAAAQQMLAGMFGTATAEAQTYAGSSAQLANAIDNLKEQFGGVLAEGLTPLIQSATSVVTAFSGMSDGTKELITYTGLAVAGLGGLVTAGGTVVAACGQMVIWYGALQTSAVGAKVAQLALNSAVGVGYVAAAAGAATAGYALGKALYSLTETAQVNERVMGDFKSATESIAGVDFTGAAQEDLETYIGGTKRQIAAIKEHNAELTKGQAWWNFWQSNSDLIAQNSRQVEVLEKNLNTAQIQAAKGVTSPAGVSEAAITAADEYTAKLQEQILTAGMSANALELWKLQQQGLTAAQLQSVAAMQDQATAAAAQVALRNDTDQLVASLQSQIAAVGKTEAEVTRLGLAARGLGPDWLHVIEVMQTDLAAAKQTEEVRAKVDQLKLSLREQIVTAGMSAEAIERWKLAQAGATVAEIAQVAALQGQAAAVRDQQAAQQAAADAQKSLQDNLAETTRQLQEQIATAGMSAEEIQRWKLAQQGATPAQLANVAALQDQAAAAKTANAETARSVSQTRDLAAATRGSAEAYDRIEAYRKMQAAEAASPKPPARLLTPPAIATAPVSPPPEAARNWTPSPAPVIPPVPPEIQSAWQDILGQPAAATPPAPAIAPVPPEIQSAWQDILGQPAAATPPAPAIAPVPPEIQSAWQDILGQPAVVTPMATTPPQPPREREFARQPGQPAAESPNVLLSAAVELLKRIADASEDDKITVEQTD